MMTDEGYAICPINKVMAADSYKYTHPHLYVKGSKNMFDYAEARSVKIYEKTLFNGLKPLLKMFATPITKREVDEAEICAMFHGIEFYREGWNVILNKYNGLLPITVRAVKEGSLIPNGNPLYSIELTEDDDKVYWVVSWLETILMKVWYTCNIGTRSFYVKKMLIEMGRITDENPFVDYQYHNFGDRGSPFMEAASVGGASHLMLFKGTDSFHSLKYIVNTYNLKIEDIANLAHSIDASEHSTITSWGRDGERAFVLNFLEKNKRKAIIACVGDSYDIFEFTDFVTKGEFKEKIESSDYPTFVIRPDSGDAVDVINMMLNIMEKNGVAYTVNKKGYKVFNKYRIIWGDGINMETMRDILSHLILRKYSTQNMAFGSGGWLMQQHDRDTLGFAIKCSEITLADGETRYVFKDPITAPGKKSKKGRVTTYLNKETNEYFCDIMGKFQDDENIVDVLEVVFVNGVLVDDENFFDIRDRAQTFLEQEIKDLD